MAIKFTDDDLAMITHLQKQHNNWKSIRIKIFITSLLLFFFGLYGFGATIYLRPDAAAVPIALIYTPVIVIAARGLSYSIGGWRGRPEISLLLKLVEASQ